MKLTFLGTGSSPGIPVIGCQCPVCMSDNPLDQRLRSSVLITDGPTQVLIDAGPDLRQQMLREKVNQLHGIVLTHEHKDHTAGIDDVRAFNYLMQKPIAMYAEYRVLETLKREYSYVFAEDRYPGAPQVDLIPVGPHPFKVNDLEITPIRVWHGMLPILGFRLGQLAYLTDVKTIDDAELPKLTNLNTLIINAIRVKPHMAHMGLDEVLTFVEKVGAQTTYLTHISHMQHNHNELLKLLPKHIKPAYDGLTIEF